MQISTSNDVKTYNLSSGRSLPDWISEQKRRKLLKQDVELRQRIELLQDFEMPTASSRMKLSTDGQYIMATGTYKPRVRCYDVSQLSMKFERCFSSEAVQFLVLSEDYSKIVFLQRDRYLEFHAQYGSHYRSRIPKFGRDMAYHYPSCDLYLVGTSNEVYRLNLDQGQFLSPIVTQMSALNVCQFNPVHQLFAAGSDKGEVGCWDPRSRTCVGKLSISPAMEQLHLELESTSPAITALTFQDGLNLALGTASGQVLMYDIRAQKPYHVQDHHYGLPINSVAFHSGQGLVLSTDTKALKIWSRDKGTLFTTVEPEASINELCHIKDSGLLLMAVEAPKMQAFYIPALGPAPKWCSFLDSLTEELEENPEPTVYEDYKFVTSQDLEHLGLSHLIGTNLLRAYMHGYFIDLRLYIKAKSIVEPFAYEEYRKNKIREKLEKERATRIQRKKLPKVNTQLAEKLLEGEGKRANLSNPLGDDRFAAMFTNPDFTIDQDSEEFKLLHPVLSKHDKKKKERKKEREIAEEFEELEEDEVEGRPSDLSDDLYSSSDDDDQEMWAERRREQQKKRLDKEPVPAPKFYEIKPGMDFWPPTMPRKTSSKASLGQLVADLGDTHETPGQQGLAYGSKTVTITQNKPSQAVERQAELKQHQRERRKIGRSAKALLTKKRGPVYWRGRRIK